MPYWLKIIVLGIVQGVTEFIPVSSSGHQVIFKEILGLEMEEKALALNLFLHLGSLLAVLYFYRKKISRILFSIKKLMVRSPNLAKEESRYLWYILIATIPTGVMGFFIRTYLGNMVFNSTLVTGFCLLITGTLLLVTRFVQNNSASVNGRRAFMIGVFQGFALFPGISRSGSTIAVSLIQKMKGKEAAEFSFMIFIPALIGASIWEWFLFRETMHGILFQWVYILGFLSSLISGFLALKLLILILIKQKLHIFSWYCYVVGALVLLYNLI